MSPASAPDQSLPVQSLTHDQPNARGQVPPDPAGRVVVVTGTCTDVGKTVTVAALVAGFRAAGCSVAVCKPAQTGVEAGADGDRTDDPRRADGGDLAVVRALANPDETLECARFREPLAPFTAARREHREPLRLAQITAAVDDLRSRHDVVVVEGAGGVLVRFDETTTILSVADALAAPMVVVVDPALGALNHAELTVGAIRAAGVEVAGLVIGRWPRDPDLARRCNLDDLPTVTDSRILGVIPEGVSDLTPAEFAAAAITWLDLSHHIPDTKASPPTRKART
ncbi:dethiobiotin synthase [Gordonia jinhuaensis]|uniref:ATP-dependent dethiobiotin synthetase BioD n=1 Tax=Gordonia jinhuaensis TaxID=1517702 RepID=A0A916SWK6_9ACTN|nr:dethiobiotin synthase [Gordonia jinhuaensis]GGB19721.1 ATP-dependent dethiobiotin synthetase BioD [Gordonia jinhuaensis]